MKRREFVCVLCAATVWPFKPAGAAAWPEPVIGFLST